MGSMEAITLNQPQASDAGRQPVLAIVQPTALRAGSSSKFTLAATVVGFFVISLVAMAGFVAAESRVAQPMVPFSLLRSRDAAVAVAVGFAFVVGYYGLPFVTSLYLQQLRGLSPFAAGLTFLPMFMPGLRTSLLIAAGVAVAAAASSRLLHAAAARSGATAGATR
jgi:hypothetical protein